MILFAQDLGDLPEVSPPDGVVVQRLHPRELPMLAYLVSRRELDAFGGLLAAGLIGGRRLAGTGGRWAMRGWPSGSRRT